MHHTCKYRKTSTRCFELLPYMNFHISKIYKREESFKKCCNCSYSFGCLHLIDWDSSAMIKEIPTRLTLREKETTLWDIVFNIVLVLEIKCKYKSPFSDQTFILLWLQSNGTCQGFRFIVVAYWNSIKRFCLNISKVGQYNVHCQTMWNFLGNL